MRKFHLNASTNFRMGSRGLKKNESILLRKQYRIFCLARHAWVDYSKIIACHRERASTGCYVKVFTMFRPYPGRGWQAINPDVGNSKSSITLAKLI